MFSSLTTIFLPEEEAIVTPPPITKKQAAKRQAVKPADQQPPPAKIPRAPKNPPKCQLDYSPRPGILTKAVPSGS